MKAVKIQYAHAIKDPFDNTIAKPFELRKVSALVSAHKVDDDASRSPWKGVAQ